MIALKIKNAPSPPNSFAATSVLTVLQGQPLQLTHEAANSIVHGSQMRHDGCIAIGMIGPRHVVLFMTS